MTESGDQGFALQARTQQVSQSLRRPGNVAQLLRVGQILLLVLFSFLLARLFWVIFSPLPAPSEAPVIVPAISENSAPQARLTTARNPFALAEVAFVETEPEDTQEVRETSLNLKLHGVRIDGARATAIIDVVGNGGQRVVQVGDEITNGVEVTEIKPGEVIITRAGRREALRLEGADTLRNRQPSNNNNQRSPQDNLQVAERQTSYTPSSNKPVVTNASDLQKIFRVRRRTQANGQQGLYVFPGTERETFAETGLVAQDLILSVNGTPPPVNLRDLYQLMTRLAGAGSVALVVERDGTPRTVTINFNQSRHDTRRETDDGLDAEDEVEL